MARKRLVHTFKQARDSGPYDEYPVLTEEVDPQIHLSRNDRRQPFFLTCGKDTVLVQMSGRARVEFRDSSVNTFDAVPGDYIYVPAGTPHRISPEDVAIQYRYKARTSGLEGLSFRCPECDQVLSSEVWDTSDELPQKAYLRIVEAFNADDAARKCSRCASVHPVIDLTGFRWREIVEEFEAEQTEEAW